MAYILDLDVFIQASNLHYRFSFCSAFWDWIDGAHAAGNVYSLDRVRDEILEGEDADLEPWCKARPQLFLKSADVATYKSLELVAGWASKNYHEAGYANFFAKADFVLVGYTHAHNHILVTQEVKAESDRKIKIPNACNAFGVKCINTWEMLAELKARFVLA